MVTGSKSSFNDSVHSLFNRMRVCLDKKNVDYLEVDGVANVLEERVRAGHSPLLNTPQQQGCHFSGVSLISGKK